AWARIVRGRRGARRAAGERLGARLRHLGELPEAARHELADRSRLRDSARTAGADCAAVGLPVLDGASVVLPGAAERLRGVSLLRGDAVVPEDGLDEGH